MGFPFPFRLVTLLLAARPAGFRGPRSDFFWACGKPYIIVYGYFRHRIWSGRRAPQTASTNRRAAKYGQNFSRSEGDLRRFLFLFAERGRGRKVISRAQPSAKKYTGRCATQNVYRRHLSKAYANNGSEIRIPRVPPPHRVARGVRKRKYGKGKRNEGEPRRGETAPSKKCKKSALALL